MAPPKSGIRLLEAMGCVLAEYRSSSKPKYSFIALLLIKYTEISQIFNYKYLSDMVGLRTGRIQLLTFMTILFVLPACNAVEFTIRLTPSQRFCFYQVFEAQHKYTFITSSTVDRAHHEVEVSHIYDRSWKSAFYKSTTGGEPLVRVDKLASHSTTYSFCIKNIEDYDRNFKIQFSTGLEMLELGNLPDANDSENMERELNWLDQQLVKLTQKAQNIEVLRRVNSQIHGMVGVKMVIFGIIGLLAIAVVNFVFFRVLRAQFKKRKYI